MNATFGTGTAIIESIQSGSVQLGEGSLSSFATFTPDTQYTGVPFAFDSREHAYAWTETEFAQKMHQEVVNTSNMYILGWFENGIRMLSNNKHPVTCPDDMKGLKIRTMSVPIHLEMFEAMGASPTPMNSSEVFSALQQGVVDGQENPCSNIYSNKYHEVQKYLTLDGHVFTFVTFVCSKEWFESLTEAEQTAVREGVDIATEYMSQACTAEDEAALEAMIAEGLQVTELTEEAKDGFRAAVADVRERNGNAINPEMYQQMMQAIEAAA